MAALPDVHCGQSAHCDGGPLMFTAKQVDQLLKPINPKRVLRDGKNHAHVSQQDVLAHLIRVFGFGNFDIDVLNVEPIFVQPRINNGKETGRFDACYRALVRLTVRDEDGNSCHYENGSTATAQNQTLGDAHDLAYKSAISLSVKRAAIALGDGFGLSLYNKGQMTPLVMDTLVHPEAPSDAEDVQDGVEQQVSLGNDEVDPVDVDPDAVAQFEDRVAAAQSEAELRSIWVEAQAQGLEKRIQGAVNKRKAEVAA